MLRACAGSFALVLFVLWPAADGWCWTDATRTRMIQDALKVTPPALRSVFERYDRDLMRGMIDPSSHETEEVHYQHGTPGEGLAAVAVNGKLSEARALLMGRRSLKKFTYDMGVLAHLSADVSFPLNASDADPREPRYREAYRSYVESKLPRIPFVLDRQPSPELDRGDVRAFVMQSARSAARDYATIGPAFKDDGTPSSPDALDERSLPYGVASLSYSRAVNDIVRLWRHLWTSVNGDVSGTPYVDAPPPDAKAPGRSTGSNLPAAGDP